MIIAIDGPAGSGKSTVAKLVAEGLGFHYLDTGAMYRAVAAEALAAHIDITNEQTVAEIAQTKKITFIHEADNPIAIGVCIGNKDVSGIIRTSQVDKVVSTVSAHRLVREALVCQQREIAASDDIVMEGRDIGTVVFPNAELKVFLSADARTRAHRRSLQNKQRGIGETDEEKLLAQIKERDRLDSAREVAPLIAAKDAKKLDTTDLTIDEVVSQIESWAQEIKEAGKTEVKEAQETEEAGKSTQKAKGAKE